MKCALPLVDRIGVLRGPAVRRAQPRERQVLGELAARVRHDLLAVRRRERDRVADDLIVAAGREPRADDQPLCAQPPDELALAGAGGGERADGPLEDLAVGLRRADQPLLVLALGAVALAIVGRARAALASSALHDPQPVVALELATRLLRARTVVMHTRAAAVLAHQLHDQVDMIAAVARQAVPQRDPPLPAEPHLTHELAGDLRPPLIRQRLLVGVQRQRAVPHVRVRAHGTAAVVDQHAAVLGLARDGHPRTGA